MNAPEGASRGDLALQMFGEEFLIDLFGLLDVGIGVGLLLGGPEIGHGGGLTLVRHLVEAFFHHARGLVYIVLAIARDDGGLVGQLERPELGGGVEGGAILLGVAQELISLL